MKPALLLAIASLLLAGCTSPTPKPTTPEACMIYGNGTFGGDSVYITFPKIDGTEIKTSFWKQSPTTIQTTEGQHTITLHVAGSQPEASATGHIQVSTIAGKAYKLTGQQTGTLFNIKLFVINEKDTPDLIEQWTFRGKFERNAQPWAAPSPRIPSAAPGKPFGVR